MRPTFTCWNASTHLAALIFLPVDVDLCFRDSLAGVGRTVSLAVILFTVLLQTHFSPLFLLVKCVCVFLRVICGFIFLVFILLVGFCLDVYQSACLSVCRC